MKAASVRELKKELNNCSQGELVELCLQLSKFKKENKELLTYLIYEALDEPAYIESVKGEVEDQFELINRSSYYFINKSVRKILRGVKKHIRYSKVKETEAELLLHFCFLLRKLSPPMQRNASLCNLYQRQIDLIKKTLSSLHEDLQYDYEIELDKLKL